MFLLVPVNSSLLPCNCAYTGLLTDSSLHAQFLQCIDTNDLIGDLNTLFCDSSSNNEQIDKGVFPLVDRNTELTADCGTDEEEGQAPEVICDCCTICV